MNIKTIICLKSAPDIGHRLRLSFDPESSPEYLLAECRGTPADILALTEKQGSAILVIDDAVARMLPISALREPMSAGKLRVLVVSRNVQDSVFHEFLEIGCDGVVLYDTPPPMIRKAIESIFDGQLWVPRKILSRMVQKAIRNSTSPKLTARESEILHLISLGYKNQHIADRLFISRDTVRWHIRSLYSKIGVMNRIGAVHYALHAVPAHKY